MINYFIATIQLELKDAIKFEDQIEIKNSIKVKIKSN